MRFQGGQGNVVLSHPPVHVRPGGVTPLGNDLRVLIQNRIQNLQPQVRHPHLIGIRKGQGKAQISIILANGAHLPTHVAGRLFNSKEIHK